MTLKATIRVTTYVCTRNAFRLSVAVNMFGFPPNALHVPWLARVTLTDAKKAHQHGLRALDFSMPTVQVTPSDARWPATAAPIFSTRDWRWGHTNSWEGSWALH